MIDDHDTEESWLSVIATGLMMLLLLVSLIMLAVFGSVALGLWP